MCRTENRLHNVQLLHKNVYFRWRHNQAYTDVEIRWPKRSQLGRSHLLGLLQLPTRRCVRLSAPAARSDHPATSADRRSRVKFDPFVGTTLRSQ